MKDYVFIFDGKFYSLNFKKELLSDILKKSCEVVFYSIDFNC